MPLRHLSDRVRTVREDRIMSHGRDAATQEPHNRSPLPPPRAVADARDMTAPGARSLTSLVSPTPAPGSATPAARSGKRPPSRRTDC
jgi:hypothetical protein